MMRLSGLSLAAVLLFSSITLAQHSSGSSGGSSSSSSSSSSGGGSHSSSSGGSSYSGGSSGGGSHSSGGGSSSGGGHSASSGSGSGGGHSSGVSHSSGSGHSSSSAPASHGTASYGSTGRASEVVVPPHKGDRGAVSTLAHPIREPKPGAPERSVQPEKRSFFTFLRHPFRKPQPPAQPDRTFCYRGHCPACPIGQARSGGGCVGATIPLPRYTHNLCSTGEIWNGGSCLLHTRFIDDCSGLRMALERQQQRRQTAESTRQSACANALSQECTDATNAWQSEDNLYQQLQARYRRCQMGLASTYRFGAQTPYGYGYGSGVVFDPLTLGVDY